MNGVINLLDWHLEPIKILRDDIEVTLLEATGKKCDFLNIVIKELNLKNIKVINARAEELSKKEEYTQQIFPVWKNDKKPAKINAAAMTQ